MDPNPWREASVLTESIDWTDEEAEWFLSALRDHAQHHFDAVLIGDQEDRPSGIMRRED